MPEDKNEFQHNTFISWSGERSRYVAAALREWLPMVLQATKPFMSKRDIEKGSRWHLELARALEVTKVGIICLTPENLSASWLLFEAGALSKTMDRGTRVCTYLLAGLQPQEVPPPLGEFQATKAEEEETRQMLLDVNKGLGSPLAEPILKDAFDLAWPKFAAKLSTLPAPETSVPPKRSLEDMVAEIMDTSRAAAKTGQELQEQVADVQRVLDRAPFGDTMMSLLAQPGISFAQPGVSFNFGAARPTGFLKDMMARPKGDNEGEKDQEGQDGKEGFRLPSRKKKP
jgi:hypothetical protein